MSARLKLIGHRDLDQAIAWRNGMAVSARRFIADAEALAAALPPGTHLLNLCEDRYRFMVGFAAALIAGRITLLPPNRTEQMLARMAEAHPGGTALADEPIAEARSDVMVFPEGSAQDVPVVRVPSIPGDHLAAIVYTSGSTGEPQPNRKRWEKLVTGAHAEQAALGLEPGIAYSFLGTIPPQHMYGLESTVVMPMTTGGAIHPARPLLAHDVARALHSLPAPRVLITTPIHIRACLTSHVSLPPVELIVSAAAPLAPDAAANAEQRFHTHVLEMYGSSETGVVATRRPTVSPAFRTMRNIRLERDGDLWLFTGGHVPGRVPVSDLMRRISDTEFLLEGRATDMINIAGKRASLGDLNHRLLEIPGVQDGVFHVREAPNGAVARLVALVVAPDLSTGEILAALRRSVDPAFLPRPLLKVSQLPRAATGKLPLEALHELAAEAEQIMPDASLKVDGSRNAG
ncbi:MAG: AMP-binding protein [Betaproteobacteria bacterium]|jgi:acyl-coenzyme A synthetase/AMP-(fatty) acid ligase|nr:AMP-binding protein [Betaproteobacteria bacterium]